MPTGKRNLKLPKNLYLESTNRCNLKCSGCILYLGGREPKRDLSLDEAVKITDQLPELEKVFLHGIGEPLLNRELPDIIRHLKGRDVYVLFNSNGTLLSGRIQRDLIRTGLNELRISLDAASDGGYRSIRRSDKFEQILGNLRSFVLLQKRQQVALPKLSLWFLGTRDNIAELPDFVKLAAEIEIGEVYLQRLVYFQDGTGYGLAGIARVCRIQATELRRWLRKAVIWLRNWGSNSTRPDYRSPVRACAVSRPANYLGISAIGHRHSCISPPTAMCCPAALPRSPRSTMLPSYWGMSSINRWKKSGRVPGT